MKDARFTIPNAAVLSKVVDMLDQVPMDTATPTAISTGTCFLVAASEYVRTTHPSALTYATQRAHFHTLTFHGYDFDSVMLRIGSSDICSPSGRRAGVLTHSHIAGDKTRLS